jgi:hypothetical protein
VSFDYKVEGAHCTMKVLRIHLTVAACNIIIPKKFKAILLLLILDYYLVLFGSMKANLYTMGKDTKKYITPGYYKENEKKRNARLQRNI